MKSETGIRIYESPFRHPEKSGECIWSIQFYTKDNNGKILVGSVGNDRFIVYDKETNKYQPFSKMLRCTTLELKESEVEDMVGACIRFKKNWMDI